MLATPHWKHRCCPTRQIKPLHNRLNYARLISAVSLDVSSKTDLAGNP